MNEELRAIRAQEVTIDSVDDAFYATVRAMAASSDFQSTKRPSLTFVGYRN